MLNSKKTTLILSFLGLFLIVSGSSWAIFTYISKGSDGYTSEGLNSDRSKINLNLPKTEECPMNGMKYTAPEKAIWETRRPVAAMVENSKDSRPASGLSNADVVYEAVAEGGITRFLSIFYCGAAAGDVKLAPVRSARVHFIDYASEYGDKPIFMHVGGANDYAGYGDTAKEVRALELLETIGWRIPKGNDFDTTYDSGFPIFWRNYERLDREVATEHTMMASLDKAYDQAEKRGFTNVGKDGTKWNDSFVKWKFKDDSKVISAKYSDISFGFWEDVSYANDYSVKWVYDKESNSYLRENGGVKHLDHETGKQLTSKNVVILFTKDKRSIDRNKHVLYTTIGEGKALIFQNGDVIEGKWTKKSRIGRTKFVDGKGVEIEFVRGPIWVEILSIGNKVDYK